MPLAAIRQTPTTDELDANAARAEIAALERTLADAKTAAADAEAQKKHDRTPAAMQAARDAADLVPLAEADLIEKRELYAPVFLAEADAAKAVRLDSLAVACTSAAVGAERDATVALVHDFEQALAARVSAGAAAIAATNLARAEASQLSAALGRPCLHSPESFSTYIESILNSIQGRSGYDGPHSFLGVSPTNTGFSIHFQFNGVCK